MNAHPLLEFFHPGLEKYVQAAVERYWPALFPEYYLVKRINMPRMWMPDLIAVAKDHSHLALVELKGQPSGTDYWWAVSQVVGYGRELLARHPDVKVKYLVAGPWKVAYKGVDYHGSMVTIVSLKAMGLKLLTMADTFLLAPERNFL